MSNLNNWTGLINAFRDRMPIEDGEEIVTLYEGNTPLVPLPYISDIVGANVYAKVEGANPTGSFKDRGMTMAVTKAKAQGKKVLICASTGNTSAALAAYATRANLPCVVLIPQGKIALGKLAQAVMHGAHIMQINGNFDQALKLVRELSEIESVGIMNSINPYRVQGQKSAAFEICNALGKAPDQHFIPVGNAANIFAYWVGYTEYQRDGITTSSPKMRGVQADGSAPFVYGFPVENPETIATAIRIGAPASFELAQSARDESGGSIIARTDEKILEAYKMIASKDGVFVEPASAASIAGLLAAHENGEIEKDSTIVCTVTGHGLKDPDTATRDIEIPKAVDPSSESVMSLIEGL
jgi:threonine synthase